MGKSEKKKRHAQKPFCYYCDRVFNGEDELVNHQVNKHFKCPECPKKLNTAQGLWTHAHNVHKVNITEVPGARAGRESMDIEIFGMNGVPEGLKPGEEVEDPSKRPKTLPVGPSSAPPPPPHPNMMMNAYSHYPVRPPPMPPGYGGYPPHYPPPHAMGHMHHPPPPHYYPPPQQLSYPPHGPPPGYTYPPPAAGPGGGGAGGGAGGGGGGPAPYFTRGAPPPGFTPPTISTLSSSVGAGGGGPQVNSISPVGVQGPPQPTRAPLFVGTAGYRPPLSSTDQAHLPASADGGGGGEGEGGKGPDEAEARGNEEGLINDGYGAAPVPNDFQVTDGNCETWQGQVQVSNLREKMDLPANLGGLTKLASFKRSSSLREGLRVQEKEEEPEVVVPSITPSLQELEEAFEHEMTS